MNSTPAKAFLIGLLPFSFLSAFGVSFQDAAFFSAGVAVCVFAVFFLATLPSARKPAERDDVLKKGNGETSLADEESYLAD